MVDVKGSLVRIETAVAELRDEVAQMWAENAETRMRFSQMRAKHAEMRAEHAQMRIENAEMRGLVRNLPTTWAMLTGIIGGQIAFVGVPGGSRAPLSASLAPLPGWQCTITRG